MADWSMFDELAIEASKAGEAHAKFIGECHVKNGTSWFDGGMISGGAHKDWPQEHNDESRRLLAIFYDAQDKAMKAKPPRVHKRTALNRLRNVLEN